MGHQVHRMTELCLWKFIRTRAAYIKVVTEGEESNVHSRNKKVLGVSKL